MITDAGVTSEEPLPGQSATQEPLATDPTRYWTRDTSLTPSIGEVHAPQLSAAWVRRLGRLPFWRGREGFLDAMEASYTRASARGLDVLNGRHSE